jgi:hypothetical protein
MHRIAKYYMHIKPLKVLHVPPCVQIQHQDIASNPTLTSLKLERREKIQVTHLRHKTHMKKVWHLVFQQAYKTKCKTSENSKPSSTPM